MALSNMMREPRREITETLVGIAAVAAVIGGDYLFASWLCQDVPRAEYPADVIMTMVLGIAALMTGLAILNIIHAIGENVCASLDRNGIQLRPKQRRQ
jgi:hypothetical protein